MELSLLGEFGLIDLIQIPNYCPEQLVVGIGDDCAVLPFTEDYYQLVSCDLLVENVHFLRTEIDARQLGYKAAAVNFSDIAAMGGYPVHIMVSAALPSDYTVEEWQGFYQGIDEICKKYRVNVIGGDTTSSKEGLVINITVIGLVERKQLHLRKDAAIGDVVFVTGPLGGSRAGLELILQKHFELEEQKRQHALQCHCRPEPCCKEVQVLNQLAGAGLHALNDISDGLLSECHEIAKASQVSMVLSAENIPVDSVSEVVAQLSGQKGLQWALTGGEDYQLVGTMDAAVAEQVCRQYEEQTGQKLFVIGSVQQGSGVFLQTQTERIETSADGYNHFLKQEESATTKTRAADHAVYTELLHWQLKEVAQQQEQQRIYRHDLHNHLACLSGLLECGQFEQARDYLQQMIRHVPQKKQVQYSQRVLLNILLNQKVQLAEERQVDIQIHCQEQTLEFLSDYDLCTLLGNLLDNGLEHGQGEDAYLFLDIWTDASNVVVIRMENSCFYPPKLRGAHFCSRKQDADRHGKGMEQIQWVTEQNGGRFHWQYEESLHRFISECIFSIR